MCTTGNENQVVCPICKASALERGCDHLAIAADSRVFIQSCIEATGKESTWLAILARTRDYCTWTEKAFAGHLLEPCEALAGVAFAWRDAHDPERRALWGYVWSRDPRLLWCQVADRLGPLAGQAESEDEDEAGVRCPICGSNPHEVDCEHIAISADDCETIDACLDFCEGGSIWKELVQESTERYVKGNETDFLAALVAPCSAADQVDRREWGGYFPGLSGVWTYVWSSDHGKLKRQMRARLKRELTGVRERAAERSRQLSRLADAVYQATVTQGGCVMSVDEAADADDEEEKEEEQRRALEAELAALPNHPPDRHEVEERERLLIISRAALEISGDLHSLCVGALDALEAFCAGALDRRGLERVRRAMSGRTAGACIIGVPHFCPNAAATVAVDGALRGDRDRTMAWFRDTIAFTKRRMRENPGRQPENSPEKLREATNQAFFERPDGCYLSKPGHAWPEERAVAVIGAWHPEPGAPVSAAAESTRDGITRLLGAGGDSCEEVVVWWPDWSCSLHGIAVKNVLLKRARELAQALGESAFFWAPRGKPFTIKRIRRTSSAR